MATIPLNNFVLVTKTLDSGSNLIYSSSLDVASILLSSQVTNISTGSQTLSVSVRKSGSASDVYLAYDVPVPVNDSYNPFSGKIVLEKYDTLYMNSSVSGSMQVVLSILQNAIN